MAMSSRGVLQHIGNEVSFTTLDSWEAEYIMYCTMMRIKTFFYFRIWKAFFVWRKGIKYRKFTHAQKYLMKNLFIVNPLLSDTILKIQNLCYNFVDVSFTDASCIEDWELFYFVESQVGKVKSTREIFNQYECLDGKIGK